MSWKRVPVWVPGAYISILVWPFVFYLILKYFPINPEQQLIITFVTVIILLICFGALLYYWYHRLFGTRYNPDI